jgi:hypothetical protein
LTDENRRLAIAEELKHGAAALKAAHALRNLSLYNDALSRLYYADSGRAISEGRLPARCFSEMAPFFSQRSIRMLAILRALGSPFLVGPWASSKGSDTPCSRGF